MASDSSAMTSRSSAARRTCLVEPREREVTLAARDMALELGRPVVFDPNLRLHRWPAPGDAVRVAGGCVEDAFLVKCNAGEARLLTGESDLERAATVLENGKREIDALYKLVRARDGNDEA